MLCGAISKADPVRWLLALVLAIWLPGGASALECRVETFEELAYSLCEVDLARDDLRLFLNDPEGRPWGHFTRLDKQLNESGQTLVFGMNAGMYHPDRSAVGLYVETGREEKSLVLGASDSNFGMLPNGVFCIGAGEARVYETTAFGKARPACRFATQSGPMLVIEGALHPRFLPDSTSRYFRNGVGTSEDGKTAVFVISDQSVTFHEFARFFRDRLGLKSALYLDGSISRLHAVPLGRSDPGFAMGPIVGVVAPQ